MSALPPDESHFAGNDTTHWVTGFREQDERVIAEFWHAHEERIRRIANRQLSTALKRRVDEDDVAQSVFRTFIRRMSEDQFSFENRDDIKNLLYSITVNKVRRKAQFHLAKKRGIDQEVYLSHLANLQRSEPTPDEIAVFNEFLEFIEDLNPDEQVIIQMRLDGHTQEEISLVLNCSERTIRRRMTDLESRLQELADVEGSDA